MLFLANISDSYWSAGVMYRLFERAQEILKAVRHRNSNNKTKAKKPPVYSRYNNVIKPYTSPRNFENTTPSTSRSNGYGTGGLEAISATLSNEGDINLDAIDQLLSPDFALRDDNYDALFSDFGLDGLGENQLFPGVQNETHPGMPAI